MDLGRKGLPLCRKLLQFRWRGSLFRFSLYTNMDRAQNKRAAYNKINEKMTAFKMMLKHFPTYPISGADATKHHSKKGK